MADFPKAIRILRSAPASGSIAVPGSKSVTNRALVAAALARGPSVLRGASFSEDSRLVVRALQALGFDVRPDEARREIRVEGAGGSIPRDEATLDLAGAGTAMRFLAAMVCLGRGTYRLDGNARMRERPIGDLVDGLRRLGATIEYAGREGCPPIVVRAGGLEGGPVRLRGDTSSQFVSGVLLAAPYARRPVAIEVTGGLVSRDYVDMTLDVMTTFGIGVTAAWEDARFTVDAPRPYRGGPFDVWGDEAGANYAFALAAATGGDVEVFGLNTARLGGELGFVDVLKRGGCAATVADGRIRVSGRVGTIGPVACHAMPDSVQTLAALALLTPRPSLLAEVANLRVKETDRIAALAAELEKFGARVGVLPDALAIEPPETPKAADVETYGDHRMAMSFAVAGAAIGGVVIREPGVVVKSYPTFFDDMAKLGLRHEPA